jgi:photosystem II stability/assembly factor-like uncharacterized protein
LRPSASSQTIHRHCRPLSRRFEGVETKLRQSIEHCLLFGAALALLLIIATAVTRSATAAWALPRAIHVQSTAARADAWPVWFKDIEFVDANNGWAVGEGGAVFHTTNGGLTWSEQQSTTRGLVCGVSFVDALNGWLGTDSGVLHSTDGGQTWFHEWFSEPVQYVAWADAADASVVWAAA